MHSTFLFFLNICSHWLLETFFYTEKELVKKKTIVLASWKTGSHCSLGPIASECPTTVVLLRFFLFVCQMVLHYILGIVTIIFWKLNDVSPPKSILSLCCQAVNWDGLKRQHCLLSGSSDLTSVFWSLVFSSVKWIIHAYMA